MTKKRVLSHCNIQVLHCPDCFYMSLSLSKMCEHFFTHQESVEWQISKCKSCGMVSSHDELLDEHIMLKHKDVDKLTGKRMLIDSLFIPELPESYSVGKEMTPQSYKVSYCCPFCEVITSDKEVIRMHLGLCHNIANVDSVDAFMVAGDDIVDSAKPVMNAVTTSSNSFDYVPDYKKLKVEETQPQPPQTVEDPSCPQKHPHPYPSVLYNFNVVAEKVVAAHTAPCPLDATRVVICPSDPELRMTVARDLVLQAYDPEPLRFLRNIVRQGIPLEELINFSWKGNRRGRPRLLPDNPSQTTNERKSMKDDVRMRSFCRLVEEVSKKPLPDNLGTYMHQFLSNLRNKNCL